VPAACMFGPFTNVSQRLRSRVRPPSAACSEAAEYLEHAAKSTTARPIPVVQPVANTWLLLVQAHYTADSGLRRRCAGHGLRCGRRVSGMACQQVSVSVIQ
jgi:hypothetical protein